jgi:hypothetical protein
MRAGCAAALTFAAAGCALISTGAYVNQPAPEPEAKGPGTMIATMAVPWHLDFQCNGRAEPCPTPEQAAACRRWLYYGGEGDPCADIPRDADFVGLTLSGGGTRSAVLSAAIMFEMQRLGILRSIDVISSVSGGSLTAALYAASCDAPQDCQPNVSEGDRIYWRERDVFLKLRHNFMGDWALSLFANPVNVARYMVTISIATT